MIPLSSSIPLLLLLMHPSSATSQKLLRRSGVDIKRCHTNLLIADSSSADGSNNDGYLSQSEFLAFVRLSSNGQIATNQYGVSISFFNMLPPELIGVYNYFACGDERYGCPSIEGIDISGSGLQINEAFYVGGDDADAEKSEQQSTFLYDLCRDTEMVLEDVLGSDTPSSWGPSAPSSSDEDKSDGKQTVTRPSSADPLFTGTVSVDFDYEIMNNVGVNAQSIMNSMMDEVLTATSSLVKSVMEKAFDSSQNSSGTGIFKGDDGDVTVVNYEKGSVQTYSKSGGTPIGRRHLQVACVDNSLQVHEIEDIGEMCSYMHFFLLPCFFFAH